MLLVIDNYDSFTYNLVQYLGELGAKVEVVRNDQADLQAIMSMDPERIVISPGPCTPAEAGISNDVIKIFGERIPILGVCLGHQCIGESYGGKVIRAKEVMHGKVSQIHHAGDALFADIPDPFTATRYHSLIVERDSLPECLETIAWTDDQIIMALRHKQNPVWGVQFHPESILTEAGMTILKNFLSLPKSRS